MGNALRVPTDTANANSVQQRQHFAPAIPGVYNPKGRSRSRADATATILAKEERRRANRRSMDGVWWEDDVEDGGDEGETLHVSEEHQECSICFEPLCKERTAVFVDENDRRTCAHFLHERCARGMLAVVGASCPICRTTCAGTRGVPFPNEDASEWFRLCDFNGQGKLSESEVLSIIRAQLPIDWRKFAHDLPKIWERWDALGEGFVTKEALVATPGGLLEYVSKHYSGRMRDYRNVPHVTEKFKWFQYWDEDGSGSLEKDEVVRALIKTFGIQSDVEHLQDVRSVVENIWCLFDGDDSGGIDSQEFLVQDGLGDAIIAAFAADMRSRAAASRMNQQG